MRRHAAFVLLLACNAPARAFAVGDHHGLGHVDGYAAFEGEMRRLMKLVATEPRVRRHAHSSGLHIDDGAPNLLG
jgi:hypothetical protein